MAERESPSSRATWRKTHAERLAALWSQRPGAWAALEVLVAEVRDQTIEECARWLDTAEWPETAALMRDDLLSSSQEPK